MELVDPDATGLEVGLEAKKQFRRVNGHLHLKTLRAPLEAHVAAGVTPDHHAPNKEVAA